MQKKKNDKINASKRRLMEKRSEREIENNMKHTRGTGETAGKVSHNEKPAGCERRWNITQANKDNIRRRTQTHEGYKKTLCFTSFCRQGGEKNEGKQEKEAEAEVENSFHFFCLLTAYAWETKE